jgi:hypothetical protein
MTPCGLGFFSPSQSSSCDTCPRGYYCGSNTTSNSSLYTGGSDWGSSSDLSGGCFNGTYCDSGMTRAPDLLRDPCPAGYYCPSKISYPLDCPAGTYSPSSGQSVLTDCISTPKGFYSIAAQTAPNGMCSAGYFCPLESSSPTEVPCPARYYRPELGAGQASDCSLCVAGGYCPSASIYPTICPKGSFCVGGISAADPCLPGSYGNSTALKESDECETCTGGSYCDGYGLTAPRGLVDSGFYCLSGCNTSTPHSFSSNVSFISSSSVLLRAFLTDGRGGSLGGVCPSGAYCPQGSVLPVACDEGYYNAGMGGKSASSCTACPPSFYCEG